MVRAFRILQDNWVEEDPGRLRSICERFINESGEEISLFLTLLSTPDLFFGEEREKIQGAALDALECKEIARWIIGKLDGQEPTSVSVKLQQVLKEPAYAVLGKETQ